MTFSARPIVIVDDDDDHVMIARTIFARIAPHAPVTAYQAGADFLGALRDVGAGALVLLDRRLGAVESFDLLAEVRRRRPDLDTVMLSASLTPADRARALRAGAIDAAEKPSSIEGWRLLLARLLVDDAAVRAA